MKISQRGTVNCGDPGTPRAVSTFPTVTCLADNSLLASYRVGSSKDSEDETIELRHSTDGGRTWNEPTTPFETTVDNRRGSLKVLYPTALDGEHLMAAALWVDRQTYPGKPLFNDQTEGCLPLSILLTDSFDCGRTWTPWRVLPVPDSIGPPSLTSPILRLPSGKLAASIETNKNYGDTSAWFQHVAYTYSEDQGRTWNPPVTVCQDPTGRIFNWDQRAGVCPDGRLVTFTWTYDRETRCYLNVQRRLSPDEGNSWSAPEDLGFTDQPSHPAILPDGRIVVAWVDRFQSRSIRARLAETNDAPFLPATEVVLYELQDLIPESAIGQGSTGDVLAEMGIWNFGLPYAEPLPDGGVMVVYYAGTAEQMAIEWVRLSL